MQYKKWVLGFTAAFGLSLPALAAEVTISCGGGSEKEQMLCEEAAKAWASETGNTVKFDIPPEDTDRRYFKYLIDFNNRDASVDVYQIDVIWPGLLGKHFIDLRPYIGDEEIQKHFPAIIENNTVDGKLVGMPWFTDVGVLFYRTDLLEKYGFEVPKDWSELADAALLIQTGEREAGNDEFWGYVFQGKNYEGLTCNALEWISAYNGGGVVNGKGSITINNPQAALALSRAAGWVGTIAPDRVTYFNERDGILTFRDGNAAFMRNWPFAWALLNDPDASSVIGKVGVAALPKGGAGGKSASTLGGWQLAVSKYSKNQEAAADLVRYLTSEKVQKQRAIEGAYAPTIKSLYEDSQVLEANPFFAKLPEILENAVTRPATIASDSYMAVTAHVWEAVHDVLQGDTTAVNALSRLEDQLRQVKARGGW